mgnify:CR=1 FL=1
MTDDPDALDLHCEDDLTEEKSAKLWVKNLNRTILAQHLKMAFVNVTDVQMITVDLKSHVRYFALVTMKDAEKALG